jgi:hypothetical protein
MTLICEHQKLDFLRSLQRMKDDAEREVQLFSSGTMIFRKNCEDITAEVLDRRKSDVTDLSRLIAQIKLNLHLEAT